MKAVRCEGEIVWGDNTEKCRMSHDAGQIVRSYKLIAELSNWNPLFAYEYLLGLACRAELDAMEVNGRSRVCKLGAQEVRDIAEKFAVDQQISEATRDTIRSRVDKNLQQNIKNK